MSGKPLPNIRTQVHEEAAHRGDPPAGARLQRAEHHDGLQVETYPESET